MAHASHLGQNDQLGRYVSQSNKFSWSKQIKSAAWSNVDKRDHLDQNYQLDQDNFIYQVYQTDQLIRWTDQVVKNMKVIKLIKVKQNIKVYQCDELEK